MTATTTHTNTARRSPIVGERWELGRYSTPTDGQRLLVGQRVDGVVRLVDVPAGGHGRAYLVDRELELDGYGALLALVTEYLAEARRWNEVPMVTSAVGRRMREGGVRPPLPVRQRPPILGCDLASATDLEIA